MNNNVTVVVPIYNVEKYLPNCINSIIMQTYKNLEIILVDDGSPDMSGLICDEYAKNDNRIKVIHKSNGGLSDARNAGIEIATGEYITFVDSDDFIVGNMVEKLLSFAVKYDADIVECRNIRCNSRDMIENFAYPDTSNDFTEYIGDKSMEAFFAKGGSNTTAWGKLYRSSLFSDVRYPFGKLHEDVFTTYKLIHKSKKLIVTECIGYIYRENDNSITGEAFSERRLDAVEGKIQQANFISQHYPELLPKAYGEIIYACNQCLIKMVKSNYRGKKAEKYLQIHYRKYGKYYLIGDSSFQKKLVCLSAMANVKIARFLLRIIREKL